MDILDQKEKLFEIIKQLSGGNFIYGGVAGLTHSGKGKVDLEERIYNDAYDAIKEKVEDVLRKSGIELNKPEAFRFIDFMTDNAYTVIYLNFEKLSDSQYNVVLKFDGTAHDGYTVANHYYWDKDLTELNIHEENRMAFRKTVRAYFDASDIILGEYNKRHLYFYVIRPSICDKDYNGAAFLTTYEELGNHEINMISVYLSGMLTNLTVQAAAKSANMTAKSAIMSRNMSHNLGSHVMAYLKQHLNSVHDIIVDNVLSKLLTDKDLFYIEDAEEKAEAYKKMESVALPFLVGLGKFVSYLQERQDFIATIATDYVPYYSEVNFKDFIYDELNPDLRYKRHKDRSDLETDNILLGNIARSEGLGRPTSPTDGRVALHDIILKFRDFTGESTKDNASSYRNDEERMSAGQSLSEMREYEFSLPGGVVGRQAVFSIIENIIRNAAKHGNWRKNNRNLELSFDIFCKSDFDCVENKEVREQVRLKSFEAIYHQYYETAQDIDELYIITLTDNLEISDRDLSKLRDALREPYVSNGKMVNANKGIKEMRISASWLRSLDDNINGTTQPPEKENTKAPILFADKVDGHLRYSFCVLRPKKVAVVTSRKSEIAETNEQALSMAAWRIFTLEEYMLPETNKSFEFILFDIKDERDNNELYKQLQRASSTRLYYSDVLGVDVVTLLCKPVRSQEFFPSIEKKLYRKLAGYNEGDIVFISDGKTYDKYQGKEIQDGVRITDGGYDGGFKYLYKKHFDSKAEFVPFIKSFPLECLFVEGITGNNSTDRLIRNEDIDEMWLYRQLHAIKGTVAVFDERLFTRIFKLDESHIRTHFYPSVDIMEEHCARGEKRRLKDKYPRFKKYAETDGRRELSGINDIRQLKIFVNSHPDLFLGDAPEGNKFRESDYMSIVYDLKGIDIFTIIKIREKTFDIYGYGGYVIDGEEVHGKCIAIGTITQDEGSILVKRHNSTKCFGYITIHQGILDKIYDEFGIKDDVQAKHDFTRDFYEKFSDFGKDEIISYSDNRVTEYFLPQMYIHSGRSKPSPVDMPQKQPFIQYAAIEHAILDCKYSLIQLLDSARYE